MFFFSRFSCLDFPHDFHVLVFLFFLCFFFLHFFADARQFCSVKPPLQHPAWVEVPHGWIQVNSHSTPVLTSVRRLWVARYTETTEDRDTTTDTLHKTYESRIFFFLLMS